MTRGTQDVRVDPRNEVLGLIAQLYEKAAVPAEVRKYSDQLEVLVRTHMAPPSTEPKYPLLKLTKREARLFARLSRIPGETVTRQSAMDAIYYDYIGDEPEIKIVDVFICHMRPKLKMAGVPLTIESVHGVGFKLVAVADAESIAA